MKTFLLRFFTWWNGQTFGTQLWTRWYGEFVGEDEFGNRYFRTRDGKVDPTLGFDRRWVIYNGYAEPSKIPPSWHGWMHHIVDVPPTQETYRAREWEKPHIAQSHRHARRLSATRLDLGRRPPPAGHRRLHAVAAEGLVAPFALLPLLLRLLLRLPAHHFARASLDRRRFDRITRARHLRHVGVAGAALGKRLLRRERDAAGEASIAAKTTVAILRIAMAGPCCGSRLQD